MSDDKERKGFRQRGGSTQSPPPVLVPEGVVVRALAEALAPEVKRTRCVQPQEYEDVPEALR